MKHIFKIFIFLFFFISGNLYSTQWSVSNDPIRPAQFTTVEGAINAAANGDTILIAGSQTNYLISANPFSVMYSESKRA